MAHRYQDPVLVTCGKDGLPISFVWRGETYTVVEVLGRWHLRNRWWVADNEPSPYRDPSRDSWPLKPIAWRPSNRHYCRLEVEDHMVFDLSCDVATRPPIWVLDRVHD